jgi:uncharacterized protein YecT (DUF1311 family)
MLRLMGVFVAMLMLLPLGAVAENLNCAGSQYEMNQCAAKTLQAEDVELNTRYQAAMGGADDATAKDLFRNAQRAWLAYRDATCAWEGDAARGGTLRPLLEISCAEQMTRQRLLELSHGLERREPGLSAGVMLARLREHAPEAVLTGVYWLPEGVLAADFNGDGAHDLAAVGLQPASATGGEGMVHVLVLPAGAAVPLHASIRIGDGGFCAAPAKVRLEYPDGQPQPLLAIDDGACDAFRIGLTEGVAPQLRVLRN